MVAKEACLNLVKGFVQCLKKKKAEKGKQNLILVQNLKKVKPKKVSDKDIFSSLSDRFLRPTFKTLSLYFPSLVLVFNFGTKVEKDQRSFY